MKRYPATAVIVAILAGCAGNSEPEPDSREVMTAAAPASEEVPAAKGTAGAQILKLPTEHLSNVVQVHPRVISGGLPGSEAAFRELKQLGVKTIISVDGARPDVEAAARHGLRYVHLPHGYDGIPQQRARELAKAVRELEGPVYLHCHHGKHRSPAAASVACVTAGLVPSQRAVEILELAGTSRDYRGLYQAANAARPLEAALLEELEVDFREVAPVPPMAEAMVQMEHTHEHLRQIAAAGWRTPVDHPDLVPAHEALLMQEHFTELLRTDEVREQSEEFRRLMEESEAAAGELLQRLKKNASKAPGDMPTTELNAVAQRLTSNCKVCHSRFRDNPVPRPVSSSRP